jgi:hypothetical protein
MFYLLYISYNEKRVCTIKETEADVRAFMQEMNIKEDETFRIVEDVKPKQ